MTWSTATRERYWSTEARQVFFAQHVEIDPSGCWLWTGKLWPNGYGYVLVAPHRVTGAHRMAYTWTKGPILDGLDMDHLCRVRRCVNPDHLEAVTRQVNLLRGDTIPARRAAQTHCWRGHPLSGPTMQRDKLGRRVCLLCRPLQWQRWKSTHQRVYT